MQASTRAIVRGIVRDKIRDRDATAYVFADSELNTYLGNAIGAFSMEVPREVSGTVTLQPAVDEYDAPDGLIRIDSLKTTEQEYSVVDLFAGKMTLSPVPASSGSAKFRYFAQHSVPASDSACGSYDGNYEDLIITHIVAQCWETLAGDGARYFEYQEGDVRENQGKTQSQFRTEADKLYGEFNAGIVQVADMIKARRPTPTTRKVAGAISHKAPTASKTIYKQY